MSSGSAPDVAHGEDREGHLALRLETLAIEFALAGAAMARDRRTRQLDVTTKSSSTDVVTDADRAVEALIRAEIARRRPEDTVLGEEGGDARDAASPVRWLIDPIDGTVNYLLGLPHYAVSVAAESEGTTIAACVVNASTEQVFHAALGHGAYLGEHRLSGPRLVPLADAVIATGFGYDADRRARQGRVVGELVGRVGNLRRFGSAALDLCALAAGWVDGYFEGPLGEWDIAAGLLIAAEAGVTLSGLHGGPAGPQLVAGCHAGLAPSFFAVLSELGADRVG
jgi:myo-inositol-1(or 4)-monophosphatase